MKEVRFKTTDAYISSFPEEIHAILKKIRSIVKKIAPGADEGISYGIPSYKINGKPLVYFAAFKNHVGFYATPSGHKEFDNELAQYRQGKGSVQFPYAQKIPYNLIKNIVSFRLKELKSKTGGK